MTAKEKVSRKHDDLRKRAEEKLKAGESWAGKSQLPKDAQQLLYELKVHHIELEMQNEELRRAQEELEASQARYFDLYNLAPIGYFTLSKQGLILEANLTGADMLGAARNMLVKQPFSKFIHPEYQDVHYLHYKQLIETGARQDYQIKMARHGDDGSEFWSRVEAVIMQDAEGMPTFRSVVIDITDYKNAEKALLDKEERLKESQAMGRIGSWEYDVRKQAIIWSDEAFVLYERDPKLGPPTSEEEARYYSPEQAKLLRDYAALAIKSGKGFSYDVEVKLPSNKTTYFHAIMHPVKDSKGHVAKLFGTVQDISERKKMETELIKAQKLDSLGMLAGGIAHDFNNLLSGIIGNLSIMRYKMDPKNELCEILNEAEKASFRAKSLTQQLLTFSKGGAPVKKLMGLSDLLIEAATFASRGSKAKCRFKIAPDLKISEMDSGQIQQVISNIVINAVQAMLVGGDITIEAENITIEKASQLPLSPGSYIYFSIKDTGNGIPPEYLDKIFDPYFTTKQTGSGLGLATCYSIVKKHGGHITAESESGKGATITVYLPAYTGKAGLRGTQSDTGLKTGSGRILVMDDDKMICSFLKRMLTELGYKVETVFDGNDAASLYEEFWKTSEAFDAVILDLTVPGGRGGIETLKDLKKLDPGIKAIVSSGYSNDPILANYSKHGFAAVLPKPYDVHEISIVLHELLKKNRPDDVIKPAFKDMSGKEVKFI